MRLLLFSCLMFIVSMAQTDIKQSSRRVLQDCTNDSSYTKNGVTSSCELTESQCIEDANLGMCGTDPDRMLSCCKAQCLIDCGADPCTCSGLEPGTYDNNKDFGSTCAAYELTEASLWYDSCTHPDVDHCGIDNWCILEWCYVLDKSCPNSQESTGFADMYYSYEKCGSPDCYTCTLSDEVDCPEDCPYIPDGSDFDCDCPIYCLDESWIGDGQCDRRDYPLQNCRNCATFYVDNEIADNVDNPPPNTFDCNSDTGVCDCDPVDDTTVDPRYMMVVDGEMYCTDMIGVCTTLSFQANIASRDTSTDADPNNYGTLRDRGVGRQGWFALQIENGGTFHADLISTRGVAEEDHPIEYVLWGPFDDYLEAKGNCPVKTESSDVVTLSGNGMGAPRMQSSGPLKEHTIDINDVSEGEVYVLMISDSNDFQGTTTLDATTDATMSCDIQVTDTFACRQNNLIDLRFTDATEVVRHNLAGYWAEKKFGQLNNEPHGIYYSNVGDYIDPDTSESRTLGLRVEAMNPGAYRCAFDGDIDNCELVMTGMDTSDQYLVDQTDVYEQEQLTDETQHLLGDPIEKHFGQINLLRGSVELKFEVVYDDPISDNDEGRYGIQLADDEKWDRVKLSIFDIDSGMADGEAIKFINATKICPGGVVQTDQGYPYYLSDRNVVYLDYSNNDFQSAAGYRWDIFSACWVRRSSDFVSEFRVSNLPNCVEKPGDDMEDTTKCRYNNPLGPDNLEEMQKLMSVEAEFENVGSDGMQVVFIVSRDHLQSRALFFGGESVSIGRKCCKDVVVCGHGYMNGEMECTDATGDASECTEKNCCNQPPSSYGDPIIHTFHGQCYDLNQDGHYLATAHPAWQHEVHIAVYNDYMRQISITNLDGDVLLSVNNFGEVLNNGWVGRLKVQTIQCPENYKKNDCVGEYINVAFDCQDLYFDVMVGLRHTYQDQALKHVQSGAGVLAQVWRRELGYHMDIFPQPYFKKFNPRRAEYSGLYFYNPLPEEMPECTY